MVRNQITDFWNSADLLRQHHAGVGVLGVLLASGRPRVERNRRLKHGPAVQTILRYQIERRGTLDLPFGRRSVSRGRLSTSGDVRGGIVIRSGTRR
jgi:hypothetical protein